MPSLAWTQKLDEETLFNLKLACTYTGMKMKEFVRMAIAEKIARFPPDILARGGFDFRLYSQNYGHAPAASAGPNPTVTATQNEETL